MSNARMARFLAAVCDLLDAPIPEVTGHDANGANGWRLSLPGGIVLSVQRHEYAYADEDTAEIAAWDAAAWDANDCGPFLWPEQVRGYQTTADIVRAVVELRTA